MPSLGKLIEDITPTINRLREKLDRDETVILLEKLADNTDTLINLLSMMEGLTELNEQLMPSLSKLIEDVTPTINRLREKLEDENTLLLIEHLLDNKKTLIKLFDTIEKLDREGVIDDALNLLTRPAMASLITDIASLSDEDIENFVKGVLTLTKLMEKLAEPKVVQLLDAMLSAAASVEIAEPRKVGTFGLIAATRDDEIKITTGILLDFLRCLCRSLCKPA
jgi:uncharacterized protein YjgD (DUF1641 family)